MSPQVKGLTSYDFSSIKVIIFKNNSLLILKRIEKNFIEKIEDEGFVNLSKALGGSTEEELDDNDRKVHGI